MPANRPSPYGTYALFEIPIPAVYRQDANDTLLICLNRVRDDVAHWLAGEPAHTDHRTGRVGITGRALWLCSLYRPSPPQGRGTDAGRRSALLDRRLVHLDHTDPCEAVTRFLAAFIGDQQSAGRAAWLRSVLTPYAYPAQTFLSGELRNDWLNDYRTHNVRTGREYRVRRDGGMPADTGPR